MGGCHHLPSQAAQQSDRLWSNCLIMAEPADAAVPDAPKYDSIHVPDAPTERSIHESVLRQDRRSRHHLQSSPATSENDKDSPKNRKNSQLTRTMCNMPN